MWYAAPPALGESREAPARVPQPSAAALAISRTNLMVELFIVLTGIGAFAVVVGEIRRRPGDVQASPYPVQSPSGARAYALAGGRRPGSGTAPSRQSSSLPPCARWP